MHIKNIWFKREQPLWASICTVGTERVNYRFSTTVNVYLTTCEVLSHNASEKNDYMEAIILWGGLSLITLWVGVSSKERKCLNNFCYSVALHNSSGKYIHYNFYWVAEVLYSSDNQAFNCTEKWLSRPIFHCLRPPLISSTRLPYYPGKLLPVTFNLTW